MWKMRTLARLFPLVPFILLAPFIFGQLSCFVEVPAREVAVVGEAPAAEVIVGEAPPPPRQVSVAG